MHLIFYLLIALGALAVTIFWLLTAIAYPFFVLFLLGGLLELVARLVSTGSVLFNHGRSKMARSESNLKKRRQSFADNLEKFGKTWLLGIVIVGALPVVVTLLLKIYSAEIAEAWPLGGRPGPHWKFIWPALIFWICTAVWIPSFVLREWARNRETKRLETLPSGGFLNEFGEILSKIESSVTNDLPHAFGPSVQADDAKFARFVRELLRAVARLAKLYDRDRSDAVYAANVMIFVPKDKLTEEVTKLLHFCDLHNLDSLSGALVLSTEFSSMAHAKEGDAEKDNRLKAIALPVPKEAFQNGGKAAVLPGAPRVFLGLGDVAVSERLQTHCVDDIRELNFRDFGLGDREVNWVAEYYSDQGDGRAVRSFISFPLIGTSGATIGVLNIHCNKPRWLGGAPGRKANSTLLMLPLVNEISSAVDLWGLRARGGGA